MSNTLIAKYGSGELMITIPVSSAMDVILPPETSTEMDALDIVRNAIHDPVSKINLNLFTTECHVAIAINDKTRPVPHQYLLPPLLEYLHDHGVRAENITFYIAVGTHVPMQENEFSSILDNDILSHYRVVSHDCDDADNLEYLGDTELGTPVYVNRGYYQADIKIVVGNIEPHHFMGFSGGVKSAAIGLTGRETIKHNHAFLVQPQARTGEVASNPCRIDVEQIGATINVHLALNAILTKEKKMAHCLFGDPLTVMTVGIPLSIKVCQVQVKKKYDLVIASAGGYPKDINLYQAQKAISNAAMMTTFGGEVILLAECREGIGSAGYESFMEGVTSVEKAFEKFNDQGFSIGPHKAFLIARQLVNIRISMLSKIADETVSRLLLEPIQLSDIQFKVEKALANGKSIAFMPYAVATVPEVVDDGNIGFIPA